MYNFFIISTSRMEEEPYLSEINKSSRVETRRMGMARTRRVSTFVVAFNDSRIGSLTVLVSPHHLQVDLFVVIQFEFSSDPKEDGSVFNHTSASRLSAWTSQRDLVLGIYQAIKLVIDDPLFLFFFFFFLFHRSKFDVLFIVERKNCLSSAMSKSIENIIQ